MNALFEAWTGLRLADPAWLWLALLVPAAILLPRRRAPALRFAPAALWGPVGAGPRPPRSLRVALVPLPRVLEVAGLLCAVLALARPAERAPLPQRAEGVDLLLCLDTSSSMTADDMDRGRTRLAVARDAAASFVRGRPEDRIGLVAFARYPDLLCPPTLDHEALLRILGETAPVEGEGPEDATGIGAAVAKAAQVLSGSEAKSKAIVLLTDGDENVATSRTPGEIAPAHAAQFCQRAGVRVYAVVAGTGRPGPSPGSAWARPDTAQVEALARRTGGEMLLAPDAATLGRVYARVDALERTPFEEPRWALEDRFLPFLAAAVALLLAARLLAATALDVLP